MRRTAVVAMAVMALLAAGCQGGGDVPSSPTGGPSVSTPATPTISPPSVVQTSTPVTSTPPSSPTAGQGKTPGKPRHSCSGDAEHAWVTQTSERESVSTGSDQEITGVRVGYHKCYDRVVLDLTGTEPGLGWYASFKDEAIQDPSGEPMGMEGNAFLELSVRGINWVEESAERYSGDAVSGEGTELVTEVQFGGLFEGYQQVVVGLRQQTAYRVFALSDPARIVIDVQHP